MKQLIFAPLASIGSENFVYDAATDKWTLNEDAVNRLFCDVANAGAYSFTVFPGSTYFFVAFKGGATPVMDVTDRTVTAV